MRSPVFDAAPRAGRRRAAWLIAAVVVVIAVIATLVIARGNDEPRVTAYHGPLPRFAIVRGYHVTYRVTARNAKPTTQDLFVRRPFESFEEQMHDGKSVLTTVTRLGDEVLGGNGQAGLVHTPLSPTKRDVRLDAVAADAISAHRLRVVGRWSVLHTTCYVVRSAAALNSGPLQPIARRSYVDSCVDGRSIVLDERTYANGRLTMERRATSVEPNTDGADFAMKGRAIPAAQGGGGIRELTIDSRPPSGPFWDIAEAPAGFVHVARYAVVPSQPQAYGNPGEMGANPFGLPGSLVASIDDVYVRGVDAIVIEQGSTVNDAKFNAPSGGTDVDLGAVLGRGQVLLSASGNEIDAEPHEGRRFVRVVGTVPSDQLIALARTMTLQPAGTERVK